MDMFNEVVYAPDAKLSLSREVYDLFLGRYTKVGQHRLEVVHTVRTDLTKNLSDVIPVIMSESKYATAKELGYPEDWTPVKLYKTMLNMVALLSARVFVGFPLSRDEEWLNMTIEYTMQMVAVQTRSKGWNPLLRPLIAPFLPEVRKAASMLDKARKYVEPLVKDVMADHDREKTGPSRAGMRGSFISWLINNSPPSLKTSRRIGESQLLISFAAIHTTSMSGSNVIFDLACRPEYIQPLREEIESVIREDGMETDADGLTYLGKQSFAKLKLLDSFIKESQRLSPLSFLGMMRTSLQDYTFSNGITIPEGTRIAFPMWALHQSDTTTTYSPEYNKDTGNAGPEVFDGYRFLRLRNLPGRETRHQAVTTGPEAINFGHGPHSCPGRFFAIYEIKVLLVELLLNYDIRIKGDVDGKGGEHLRPKNYSHDNSSIPNPTGEIEIRKRRI
ncbi:cytochrome P450 [Thozetella sp. PMI_491]|nr:cytochrome P450 [Thozetella sp. PMI_491]